MEWARSKRRRHCPVCSFHTCHVPRACTHYMYEWDGKKYSGFRMGPLQHFAGIRSHSKTMESSQGLVPIPKQWIQNGTIAGARSHSKTMESSQGLVPIPKQWIQNGTIAGARSHSKTMESSQGLVPIPKQWIQNGTIAGARSHSKTMDPEWNHRRGSFPFQNNGFRMGPSQGLVPIPMSQITFLIFVSTLIKLELRC